MLPASPPYHALSWAWGKGKPDHSIQINGHEFLVTKTLHDAFAHLCSDVSLRGTSFLIWTDSICINQNDNAEKRRQVLHSMSPFPLLGCGSRDT